MRLCAAAVLLALTTCAPTSYRDDSPLLTAAEVSEINTSGLWEADLSLLPNMTLGELRARYTQASTSEIPIPEENWGSLLDYVTIPNAFDSRTQWSGCTHPIQNENDCIGSWAVSATDVLSDRICIQNNVQVTISPQYIINCQSSASGCDGGSSSQAWTTLGSTGAPSTTCIPFVGATKACPVKCSNGSSISYYKATSVKTFNTMLAIQAGILQAGPIQACFNMYSDFLVYRSGIYQQKTGTLIGTQCVKVVGWGVSGNTSYWIGAGTFGVSWGQNGFFYMKMGQCGIESAGIAGLPAS